jgi:prepilin-type N-terminal cleavage/methylation domain-containing protein
LIAIGRINIHEVQPLAGLREPEGHLSYSNSCKKKTFVNSPNCFALARQAGFSLLELLVVIAIVAILAVGGSYMLGTKQSGAVRALMDELEGSIVNAHQSALSSSRDTALACWGGWDKDNPMRIAFGDARILTQSASGAVDFIAIASEVVAGKPPTESQPAVSIADVPLFEQQTVAIAFQYSHTDTLYQKAGIVLGADTDAWAKAQGKSDDITGVVPFSDASSAFASVLNSAENNFCIGLPGNLSHVSINGTTKRFTRSVFIRVITVTANGDPIADGPVGVIVLLENSASVFKFYNPGSISGDGKWRRI